MSIRIEAKITDSLGRPLRPGNIAAIVDVSEHGMPDVTIWTILDTRVSFLKKYDRVEFRTNIIEHGGKLQRELAGTFTLDHKTFYFNSGVVLKLAEGESMFFM
jgi:hypothetical protein